MAIKFAKTEEKKPEKSEAGKRGRPRSGNETITLRLNSRMLDKYRASGEGWQKRLNADLMRIAGL